MTRSMPHFALPHLSDEAVAAYADGVLIGGPRARAQQHLSECADCAAAVHDQQQTSLALRSAVAPMVPGSLLARLRELPTSAPLGGQPIMGAMSIDGYPAFAAFDSRKRAPQEPSPRTAQLAPPAPQSGAPSTTAFTGPTALPAVLRSAPLDHSADPRRRMLAGVGVSAAAAAALIVGVLASTASTAGGATSTPAPANGNSPTVSVPNWGADSVLFQNLIGR